MRFPAYYNNYWYVTHGKTQNDSSKEKDIRLRAKDGQGASIRKPQGLHDQGSLPPRVRGREAEQIHFRVKSDRFTLSSSFWKRFYAQYWGKKPVVIRDPFQKLILTPQQILESMPASVARSRKKTPMEITFLTGERKLARRAMGDWFPDGKDATMKHYLDRTRRRLAQLGEERFACAVGEFYIDAGWERWTRLRTFLSGLNAAGNYPGCYANMHVFMGNNPVSYMGVHRDLFDVFCFIIDGNKRFRVWPHGYFDHHPDRKIFEYDEYKKDSILLEGKPGDILYWPKSYWHVAEIDSDHAISLSLLVGTVGTLSKENRINIQSASLFQKVFDRRSFMPLSSEMYIQADPLLPVLWERRGRELHVSACGHSLSLPYRKELTMLLGKLNRGSKLRVGSLLKGLVDEEAGRFLLHSLYSFRAFEKTR